MKQLATFLWLILSIGLACWFWFNIGVNKTRTEAIKAKVAEYREGQFCWKTNACLIIYTNGTWECTVYQDRIIMGLSK